MATMISFPLPYLAKDVGCGQCIFVLANALNTLEGIARTWDN